MLKTIHVKKDNNSSESDLSGSDSETDLRQVCMATRSDHVKTPRDTHTGPRSKNEIVVQDHGSVTHGIDQRADHKACTHCGSTKHNDRDCWKRLTCQKCGRKGHPSDKCFFVCAACGDMHEGGKCLVEEFYNMIRQLYVPTKHAGMLPPRAEEMLN